MAICDAKLKFLMIDVGSSGRRGDGNVYHRSAFSKMLRHEKYRPERLHLPDPCPLDGIEEKLPFFFIGDAAFSRGSHLITPFKGKFLPPERKVFNYRISRGRRGIENAFGLLYKRYEVYQKPLQCSFVVAKAVVKATCALHNYHLMDEESVRPKKNRRGKYFNYTDEDGKVIYGRFRNEDPVSERKVFHRLKEEVAQEKAGENLQKTLKDKKVTEALIDYVIDHDVPWQWECANLTRPNPWIVTGM